MKTLYFDCFSGASGDMIVGALIDAGADFDVIRHGLDSLRVAGYTVAAEKTNKGGIMATQFSVCVSDQKQPLRRLDDILEIIDRGDLPETAKRGSAQTFHRIAECEAEVHGAAVEQIHFHEVGAIDSIVDVVAAHLAMHTLQVDQVIASPLPVGSGSVVGAHGVMPVPAPATALLLKGAPCYGDDTKGELVTPTGAALITQFATEYGPMPAMTPEAVGYGSGTRELADRANVLRVFIGRTGGALPETEPIVVVEANIDDMNPELFPPLIADLLKQGSRDAFLTPLIGKKGRPAHLVTVLCDQTMLSQVVSTLFRGSTTLGIRMRTERRICLKREWKKVRTAWGDVRIKIGLLEGVPNSAAPEFEDCRRVAEEAGVPVLTVYEAAFAAAVKGEMENA